MVLLDIEIPKNCKDCRINVYGRCGALRTSVLLEMANEERNDNCPIKAELPKDATNGDLLLSIFQEKSDCFYPIGTDKMGFTVDVEWWNAPWEGQENAE